MFIKIFAKMLFCFSLLIKTLFYADDDEKKFYLSFLHFAITFYAQACCNRNNMVFNQRKIEEI